MEGKKKLGPPSSHTFPCPSFRALPDSRVPPLMAADNCQRMECPIACELKLYNHVAQIFFDRTTRTESGTDATRNLKILQLMQSLELCDITHVWSST
jgi:hypothetical protein